ncbi:MAG: hypothetical protein ACTSRW_08625 [Candidatus Helarchaeota archaeon]
MLVFTLYEINEFVSFLPYRIHREIFYDFTRANFDGLSVGLAFLAKIDLNVVLVQTVLNFPGIQDKDAILKKIRETDFGELDLEVKFVHGSIKEIYMSIS